VTKNLFLSLSLLSTVLLSCSDVKTGAVKSYTPAKGSEEFKTLLAQGSGRIRPSGFAPASRLGLNNSSILSTSLDSASGAWARVLFDTRISDRLENDDAILTFGRELLGKYSSELGFSPTEADAGVIYSPDDQTRVLTFQRAIDGVPIQGAFVKIFFARFPDASLRLSEIVNNSYGPVKVSGDVKDVPSDADTLALTGIWTLQVLSKKTVIQPVLGPNGRYEFGYASVVKVKDSDDEEFTLTVDHEGHQLREVYSNRVNELQTISAEVYQRSYVLNDIVAKPLPFAAIVDGTTKLMTDGKGVVSTVGKTVTVKLNSNKSASTVVDFAVNTKEAANFTANLDASGKTTIKLSPENLASVNAFVAIQGAVDFVSKYLTIAELPLLDSGILATVNRKEDVCNAFYENGTLNFFAQGKDVNGKTCANTALISDVVYHEWGHAMDDFLGPVNRTNGSTGITDGAYSEGIGDILSAYMSRAPNLGVGIMLGDKRELRSLKNTRKHPPANAQESEVHEAGLIIGGAFWDMFTLLSSLHGVEQGADLSSKLFLKHLKLSDRYLDAYSAVLRADDDDNNPATPSANYCNITRAFALHNISGAEVASSTCVDNDKSLNIRVDLDEGNGKLSLLASAAGATKILACPGLVKLCKADTAGFVELASIEADDTLTLKGERKYYAAKGSFDVKTNVVYTFFSVDSENRILGLKNMRFKIRDNTAAAPSVLKP
jgi:hypothetical protein